MRIATTNATLKKFGILALVLIFVGCSTIRQTASRDIASSVEEEKTLNVATDFLRSFNELFKQVDSKKTLVVPGDGVYFQDGRGCHLYVGVKMLGDKFNSVFQLTGQHSRKFVCPKTLLCRFKSHNAHIPETKNSKITSLEENRLMRANEFAPTGIGLSTALRFPMHDLKTNETPYTLAASATQSLIFEGTRAESISIVVEVPELNGEIINFGFQEPTDSDFGFEQVSDEERETLTRKIFSMANHGFTNGPQKHVGPSMLRDSALYCELR